MKNPALQSYKYYFTLFAILPVAAILFYIGIGAAIEAWRQMAGLQEEKEKFFVAKQQVCAMRERMREVEQFYQGISQMKHEMRNHMTNIRGLALSGNYDDMEQYISGIDKSMDMFEFAVKTGNAVTDVIINDKQKAAGKQGIQFQSDFSYPDSDRYNAYDIAIIINNLLVNALEACEKMKAGKKYIFISGRQKKKFFLITVKNSFVGEITFDTYTNLPVSTKKKEAFMHGIGLSNVNHEVEKYMGDMDINVKKNEFNVTILLQENCDD